MTVRLYVIDRENDTYIALPAGTDCRSIGELKTVTITGFVSTIEDLHLMDRVREEEANLSYE